jgi:ribosomal protein S18 acetylase RimI-like enzyme
MASTDLVRPVTEKDVEAIQTVIDATGLFPSSLLEAMIEGYLNGESHEYWLTIDRDARPIAVAYCAPESMTEGTWNLLLVAVHPEQQGNDLGASLIRQVEQELRDRDQMVLLVETSGMPEFERTRGFYRRLDFAEEARIRDFYAPGDDKVVFWKRLNGG